MRIEKSGKERWLLLVLSVNKRSADLSKGGHGFCVVGSRILQEVWVSDFAWCWTGKAARERVILDRGHGPSGRLRALGQSLMQYFCYSHLVDAATGEVEFAIWGRHHIANYAAAGGNRGRNSESPCFWVEAHESVWPETCFHVPHHTVQGGRDGVGFTVGTPGERHSSILPVAGSKRPRYP